MNSEITADGKYFELPFFQSPNIKPGGLDVRDQSRSRSRMSIVSRLTFENRRDYPSRQDRLLFYLGRDF